VFGRASVVVRIRLCSANYAPFLALRKADYREGLLAYATDRCRPSHRELAA
jgi:hypothetical protein